MDRNGSYTAMKQSIQNTMWSLLPTFTPPLRTSGKAFRRMSRRMLERHCVLRARIFWGPRILMPATWKASYSHALLQCTLISALHQPSSSPSQKPRLGPKGQIPGGNFNMQVPILITNYHYCAMLPFCLLFWVPLAAAILDRCELGVLLSIQPPYTCFRNGGCSPPGCPTSVSC